MKIIKTYSSEHIINDREVKIIVENANSDNFLLLDSGEYIKPKSVIAIINPDLVPYWEGYILDKNGKSFIRDGNRIFLETQDYKNIEYKLNPKYKAIEQAQKNVKLLNKKNG